MRDDVRQALEIGPSATIAERTVDITTVGRRSGQERRIEICFYRVGDEIYLTGVPGPKRRDWLANLDATPGFTFHLKNGVQADLPATATVITDPEAAPANSRADRRCSTTPAGPPTARSRTATSTSGYRTAHWRW